LSRIRPSPALPFLQQKKHPIIQKPNFFKKTTMPIKIFIVDDHYMVVEGIRSLLLPEKNIE